MTRSRDRGFLFVSLAEVLVASAVLVLILGVSYFEMVLASKYADAGQTRASLQVNGIWSVQRLYFDMRESSAASVTVLSSPPQAVSFLTARLPPEAPPSMDPLLQPGIAQTETTAASPAWQAYLIYYLVPGDPDGPLMEVWATPPGFTPGTTTVSALSSAQLTGYVNGTGSGVVSGPVPVAWSINDMVITLDPAARSAVITLTAQDQADPYAQNRATYSTTVYLEN